MHALLPTVACPDAHCFPQVRKVIWDLFALCPTPAAALAADVAAIQALIQPLGLFRKRAAAVQQLSHDFLYKQVGGWAAVWVQQGAGGKHMRGGGSGSGL